jgi:AGCS family alanine or glycine:cation symporter
MSFLDFLPLIIAAAGIYLFIKLRFFFFLHPIKTGGKVLHLMRKEQVRRSFFLALAGTLGVGNIVGVAYGISVGGAGTVFWIFVSGIFASVIKYSESALAAFHGRSGGCGMMHVIRSVFERAGKPMAFVYAALCLLLSLSMGAALQSKSVVNSIGSESEIPPAVLAAVFAAFVAFAVFGGTGKIEKITAILIPVSTLIYIFMCITVIFLNARAIPSTLLQILRGAFEYKSCIAGVGCFAFSRALKEGFARGLLSNEAGAGTSAMAQTRSGADFCAEVGLLGMCEVFFDTSLLCTLTGFSVLVSGGALCTGAGGMELVLSAMSSAFRGSAPYLLLLLIFSFAYSTVVCWYYYGGVCLDFLGMKKWRAAFSAVFIFFAFAGYLMPEAFIIFCTDYILFFMTVLTLITLIKSSERIVRLSEQYGLLKNTDIGKKSVARVLNRGSD